MCSDVRDTDHVFRADLLLHFEVPLLFAAMTIVLVHGKPAHAERRRLRIESWISWLWQWQVGRCSTCVARAGIRCSLCCLTCKCLAETAEGKGCKVTSEWNLLTELVADTAVVREVVDAVAAVDRALAVAEQIVSESDTRTEICVLRVDDATRNAVLAGKRSEEHTSELQSLQH